MAAASRTMAHDEARRASSSGLSSPSAVIGTIRPSPKVMLPSTRTARRRIFRAGVLSRRWAEDRANAPACGQHRGHRQRAGLRHVPGQHRERPPGGGEAEVGVHRAAEQLGVVRDDQDRARHHERDQGPAHPVHPDHAQGQRAGQAHDDHRDQGRRRDPGSQRSAAQLVESVRGQPDGQEERQHGGDQTAGLHPRRERGADHRVGQVPGRVRRVQQRPPVPPAPRSRRVIGRPSILTVLRSRHACPT